MAYNIKLLCSHPSPSERGGAGKGEADSGCIFKARLQRRWASTLFSLPLLVLCFSPVSNQGQGPYLGDGGRRASSIGWQGWRECVREGGAGSFELRLWSVATGSHRRLKRLWKQPLLLQAGGTQGWWGQGESNSTKP